MPERPPIFHPPTARAPGKLAPQSWLRHRSTRFLLGATSAIAVLGIAMAAMAAMALAVVYPNLPDVAELADYRPKLPLRVYSAEGILIGEFGEERRSLTPIEDIPQVMINAVLAIEDARFYEHGGVDYRGVLRAALANLGRIKSQGASTISMQVARNVYLSSEKTIARKLYEILLTFKLEHQLTKDQILEIYMNQIFLGHRAFGFAAACETYFGKPLKAITTAEAAMLAGLPKAPAANNPIRNPTRARARQLHIIDRMEENGFITSTEADRAKKAEIRIRPTIENHRTHAEHAAEMVRQLVYQQYGEETYTRGLNVTTTIRAADQETAYRALRRGIMEYERRQFYRGPERFAVLPDDSTRLEDAVEEALSDHPDNGDVLAAVVLAVDPKKISAMRSNGEVVEITGDGLKPVQSGLSEKAAPNIKIRRGAVIRIVRTLKGSWDVTQLPEVEGAFVAMDPRDGSIQALVGGFDFIKNKFNHVTQAWRQPGSSFKPFIYSAALEKGFGPSTVVNDAELFFSASVTGSQAWEPKNYDGKFEGPMSIRTALAKSKNMVTIRVLQATGTQFAQEWATRFGFEPEKHPPYLTMALGAGSVTPMQMATAYSVFASGGYRSNPWLITRISDQKGKVLVEYKPAALDESTRVIDARNAFVMNTLLQEVTRSGTAARASVLLKRQDLAGKTGTTNDSMDAWFAGYHPSLVAITWIGYDTPRKLGERETGGVLSLPVWIEYMQLALAGKPLATYLVPSGLVQVGGDWQFEEYAGTAGVVSLGLDERTSTPSGVSNAEPPHGNQASEEKRSILDLFRN